MAQLRRLQIIYSGRLMHKNFLLSLLVLQLRVKVAISFIHGENTAVAKGMRKIKRE